MKILVTGAKGFVGKNLCAQLNNIKDGKDRTRPDLNIDAVYEYDIDSTPEELEQWCKEADFVFNLAGVNRPKETSEFMEGNFGFASTLLDTLRKHGNRCCKHQDRQIHKPERIVRVYTVACTDKHGN